jgi:hypothetical protein
MALAFSCGGVVARAAIEDPVARARGANAEARFLQLLIGVLFANLPFIAFFNSTTVPTWAVALGVLIACAMYGIAVAVAPDNRPE